MQKSPTHDKHRMAIALHEAAHAIAALEMGLPVAWVDIEHGTAEGINYTGAVCIPEQLIDRERDAKAIAVSMTCPSFLPSGDEEIDRYAKLEATGACEMAGSYGYEAREITEQAERIALYYETAIRELAIRLLDEGNVTFSQEKEADITRSATPLVGEGVR